MTNNPPIFDSVLCAVAACNQAWLATPVLNQTASAVALATEVDASIAPIPGGATASQRTLIESIVKSVLSGRNPLSADPTAYALISNAIAEAYSQYSPLLRSGQVNQTNWYVNAISGDDGNNGKSGFPLKTTEELARRIFPNQTRLQLTSDVNIFLATGNYLNAYFGVGSADENVYTMRIFCETTVGAELTVSAVTQVAAPTTRGQLAVSSGTLVAGRKIRLTSGANLGAVAFSTGLNGDAQHSFTTGFVLPHYDGFHNFYFASVGDKFVQEVPTVLLRRAEFDCGPNARIEINDAQIIRAIVNGVAESTPSGDAGGNVTFSCCDAISVAGDWQCNAGGANIFACRWTTATKTVLRGDGWLNWGSVVQGAMGVANGSVDSYGLCIDGGQLVINVEDNFEVKGNQGLARFNANQSYNSSGTIEIENGGAITAINLLTGGEFFNCGRAAGAAEIWGQSTAYLVGINIQPGSWFYQTGALADPTQFANVNFPSTTNLIVAGTSFAFSTTPRPDPNHNCGFIAGS